MHMMTNSKLNHWKKYCCEPLELVDNYAAAKADNFAGWCIHHKLEIQPDGTRVSRQQLIDQNLYYDRPASELIFMRGPEHNRLHLIGNKFFLGYHHSVETRQKMSKARKGKTLSEEHRQKISESAKGRTFSSDHRQKMSEAAKGKHWWNDGFSCKLSRECPGEGWTRGCLVSKV